MYFPKDTKQENAKHESAQYILLQTIVQVVHNKLRRSNQKFNISKIF